MVTREDWKTILRWADKNVGLLGAAGLGFASLTLGVPDKIANPEISDWVKRWCSLMIVMPVCKIEFDRIVTGFRNRERLDEIQKTLNRLENQRETETAPPGGVN